MSTWDHLDGFAISAREGDSLRASSFDHARSTFADPGILAGRPSSLVLPRVSGSAPDFLYATPIDTKAAMRRARGDDTVSALYSAAFLVICWGAVEVAIFVSSGSWWSW
jgi:hypothetical protein